jgi:hypothetical protein
MFGFLVRYLDILFDNYLGPSSKFMTLFEFKEQSNRRFPEANVKTKHTPVYNYI